MKTAFILAACLAPAVVMAANPNEFELFNYDLDSNGSVNLPGRLYVPANYDPNKSYGLVTFFHGGGEKGTNNTSQVNGNIDNLLAAAKRENFFIYAPQTNGGWNVGLLDTVHLMVGKATIDYSIDPKRLYVTGISMGGAGTWDSVSRYDGVYAAAMPIAGNRPAEPDYQAMVKTPIWAFHARDDDAAVVSTHTRAIVNQIRAADGNKPALTFPLDGSTTNPYYNTGAPYYTDGSTYYAENKLRYTEYKTGGHSIWGRVYGESRNYDWMLAQRGDAPSVNAGRSVLFDLGPATLTATDSQGRVWNTPPTRTQYTLAPAAAFALDSAGDRTRVMLEVKDGFTNAAATGLASGGIYDASITSDSWYTGASTAAAAQDNKGVLVLHGLDAGEGYCITLFASVADDDGGRGRVTRYTIGNESIDLNVVNNLDNLADFKQVIADAEGRITLTVQAAPDGKTRYGFLSSIEVAQAPEPASLTLIGLVGVGLLSRRGRTTSRSAQPTHA